MRPEQRERIVGVHYGGMAIEPSEMLSFLTDWFPNAVHLSGYGNTLFGCCLELGVSAGRELSYFPHGDRLVLGVLDDPHEQASRREPGEQPEEIAKTGRGEQPVRIEQAELSARGASGDQDLQPTYGRVGAKGTLVFSRLDETVLLINVVERDRVRLCEPPVNAPVGFELMGVESPTPRVEHRGGASVSLY
jgi:hypothetical protein